MTAGPIRLILALLTYLSVLALQRNSEISILFINAKMILGGLLQLTPYLMLAVCI